MGGVLWWYWGHEMKSFRPPFSKGGRFLRQSLKPLSADSGTLLTKRSFEGLKGNFSHEEKFPLTVFIVLLYLRKYSGEIFAEAVQNLQKSPQNTKTPVKSLHRRF